MAGTLEITDELCWMPAGWVYDNVLESIAPRVDQSLEVILKAATTKSNGGYLDIRSWDSRLLEMFTLGAKSAFEQFKSEGETCFSEPEYYPGFMEQFQQLLEMLETRTRSVKKLDPGPN